MKKVLNFILIALLLCGGGTVSAAGTKSNRMTLSDKYLIAGGVCYAVSALSWYLCYRYGRKSRWLMNEPQLSQMRFVSKDHNEKFEEFVKKLDKVSRQHNAAFGAMMACMTIGLASFTAANFAFIEAGYSQ